MRTRRRPHIGELSASITIRRYFHDCAATVTGDMVARPERMTRHYPGFPGEVQVDPYAEAVGPRGKFRARLSESEIDDAENMLLEAAKEGRSL